MKLWFMFESPVVVFLLVIINDDIAVNVFMIVLACAPIYKF